MPPRAASGILGRSGPSMTAMGAALSVRNFELLVGAGHARDRSNGSSPQRSVVGRGSERPTRYDSRENHKLWPEPPIRSRAWPAPTVAECRWRRTAGALRSVRKPGAMARTTNPVAGVARSYGGGVWMAVNGRRATFRAKTGGHGQNHQSGRGRGPLLRWRGVDGGEWPTRYVPCENRGLWPEPPSRSRAWPAPTVAGCR
jgi:hypothetical protein